MKLIVGLGNPGKEYENTRHNVGFLVLNKLQQTTIKDQQILPFRLENQFKAEITQTRGIGQDRIIFAKPQTYMNNSGEAVKKIMDYYKISSDDLWVVCDDLNLDLGVVRIRLSGSDGGHNGLKSIIDKIGSNKFIRFRVGIGLNKNLPAEKYVLQKFNKDEDKIIKKTIDKTAQLVIESISKDLEEKTISLN